ncbi:hypothetical protein [Cohnella sp. GCM10027633]|uniref:hypothetical protein n=1 Tax=unclassified Cohnella TaxID=2636738 RepID=UPI003627D6F5
MNMPIDRLLWIERAIDGKKLAWNVTEDRATLSDETTGTTIWEGGLLPAFELCFPDGRRAFIKAEATRIDPLPEGMNRIALRFGDAGEGALDCEWASWGLRIASLSAEWAEDASVVALHFGARLLTASQLARTPTFAPDFWPDWSAEGYCVPCAGSSPTKSYWRSWDMGNARLPLGSFGDAMGTPYAAAFPRPLYAAAMGGKAGWLAFGPGDVPPAAVTLELRAATACLSYSFREDLWGAPDTRRRSWDEPLRLAWGDSGYDAMARLYGSFAAGASSDGRTDAQRIGHARSFVCTWGDFKEGRYDLHKIVDRLADRIPADMIILDDGWETAMGTAEPNEARFPDFEGDVARFRANGYDVAFWQSVGWIANPELAGLAAEDLLCGPDGIPRRWTWSGNPLRPESHGYYLLDPSSDRTRRFLTERTERLVRRWRPAALKLDFGYGMPGPDVASPRNPAYRGERLALELLRIIRDAAKSVHPEVTIIYYGIHPIMSRYCDLVSIDDLGDAGDSADYERSGHNRRCLWAALAGATGMPVNTSTGYYWDALPSILLDTAVVGTNGLTLGTADSAGKPMTDAMMQRWNALEAWRRRETARWEPLWLEVELGGMHAETDIVSWGRIERGGVLAALALRGDRREPKRYEQVPFVSFAGHWALIAQDDLGVDASRSLACIPFTAGTLRLEREFSTVHAYGRSDGAWTRLWTVARDELPGGELVVREEDLSRIAGFVVE